jgi:hypothetical protein
MAFDNFRMVVRHVNQCLDNCLDITAVGHADRELDPSPGISQCPVRHLAGYQI